MAAASAHAEPARDRLGLNIHEWGVYSDPKTVIADLTYLGIRHVRAGNTSNVDLLRTYARAGIKFDLVVGAQHFDPNVVLPRLAGLATAAPGTIEAIEGFNEIDHWPVTYQGATGPDAAIAAMKALYVGVKADPRLGKVPVFDLTGVPKDTPRIGDYVNEHLYPNHAGNPLRDYATRLPPGTPKVITEIGNFSLPADWPAGKAWWGSPSMLGVDERTQAKSILNTYVAALWGGAYRVYVYELLDEAGDVKDATLRFGLFRLDNSPKPAAVAVHNLLERLGDASVASDPVAVEAPASVHHLVLRKSDGSWLVAIWNVVPFWSDDTGPLDAPAVPVAITPPKGTKVASVYDPLTGETSSQVAAPDHVVLVTLR
jgi:hypothetical protein